MAVPSTPTGFQLQQANSNVYLLCDLMATATSYKAYRSPDGVTFTLLGTSSTPYYLDTTVTANTQYWFTMAATNSDGTSAQTASQQAIATATGALSLQETRLLAQQRADRVTSNFVTLAEWNSYIRQSYFELYDLLVCTYEDYFVQTPYSFTTDGSLQYTLPADCYKLLGVDLGLSSGSQAWVTLKQFNFISRNRYLYPQITSTPIGLFAMRYRLVGNTIMFVPTPSSGQTIRLWYVQKQTEPLKENDTLDGISGWIEYVITDAAIKALQKEESDVSVLAAQKMMLIKRIEASAATRDEGQAESISDVRSRADAYGGGFGPNGDGSYGGI